jgi:hypothetical protein
VSRCETWAETISLGFSVNYKSRKQVKGPFTSTNFTTMSNATDRCSKPSDTYSLNPKPVFPFLPPRKRPINPPAKRNGKSKGMEAKGKSPTRKGLGLGEEQKALLKLKPRMEWVGY